MKGKQKGVNLQRILSLFEASELTYDELAQKTGIGKSSLQRYFTKETKKIPLPAIVELAEVFHVHPAYLSGWVDDPNFSPEGQPPDEGQTADENDGLSAAHRNLMELTKELSEEEAAQALATMELIVKGMRK